jgi:hypothetical protein
VASFHQWLGSFLLPVSLPLLPDGSGVIGLSLVGTLPLLPSWIYGLLEVALLFGALWWYWQNWERYPFAGLVLPLLPLAPGGVAQLRAVLCPVAAGRGAGGGAYAHQEERSDTGGDGCDTECFHRCPLIPVAGSSVPSYLLEGTADIWDISAGRDEALHGTSYQHLLITSRC